MLSHPLVADRLVAIIQSERRAAAEHHRRSRRIRNGPVASRTALSLATPHRGGLDLAHWLERTGRELATHSPDQLAGSARSAVFALVSELLAVAADGGLDLGLRADPQAPSIVLLRTHAAIAVRTAGSSVRVSAHRRRRLEAIMASLAGGTDPALTDGGHARAA